MRCVFFLCMFEGILGISKQNPRLCHGKSWLFFLQFLNVFDESVWFWMFSNVVRYIPGCSLRCKCEVIAKGQDKMGFISSGTKKDKPVELDTHFCWREASWMAKTFRKIPLVATNMRYYTCHSQLSWWSTCLKSSWFLWSLPEFMLRKLPGSASILWDWWEGSWWGWNPLACWTSHHYFILKKMCFFFFFSRDRFFWEWL